MDSQLQKHLLHTELRGLIAALRECGVDFASGDVADLDLASLRVIRQQFRDLLRILGGCR